MTPESVCSPWILFEAGALAKSMQGAKVIPLLFNLEFSDITGPLAQFQAKKVERGGLGEVIQAINHATDQANLKSQPNRRAHNPTAAVGRQHPGRPTSASLRSAPLSRRPLGV